MYTCTSGTEPHEPLHPLSALYSRLNYFEMMSDEGDVTDALPHIRSVQSLQAIPIPRCVSRVCF